jgi:methyltransferase (TIGR00027 family)
MPLQGSSRTMLAVMAVRAKHAEQIQDPYSVELVEQLEGAYSAQEFFDTNSRGMFTRNILVRCHAFDRWIKQHHQDVEQVLILSAGLDTRAIRLKELQGKRIFWLDYPESLKYAEAAFHKIDCDLDLAATTIPYDLCQSSVPETLMPVLLKHGIDPQLNTLVFWEGATYYIPEDATYRVIEALSKGMEHLLFAADFLNRNAYFRDGVVINQQVAGVLAYLENLGEPWIGFFDPDEMKERLGSLGFQAIRLYDRAEAENETFDEVSMTTGAMFFIEVQKSKSAALKP